MSILKKPIITEKMTKLGEKDGRYGFYVNPGANKIEIKQAIEKMYSVNVASINTMVCHGKKKVRYTKAGFQSGSRPTLKKAIVTLKKGETIDFFSNI